MKIISPNQLPPEKGIIKRVFKGLCCFSPKFSSCRLRFSISTHTLYDFKKWVTGSPSHSPAGYWALVLLFLMHKKFMPRLGNRRV